MRRLTQAQSARLDRLARDHEEAKVVGWLGSDAAGGPIIRYRDTFRYVNRWGRVAATRKPRDLSKVNL
jgi:hypothetical protein